MTKDIVPGSAGQKALLPAEVVRENVQTVLRQLPDLVSYDPTTDRGEALAARLALDPGIPAQQRDGWSGTIVEWGVSAREARADKEGELTTLPALSLLSSNGEVIVLYGWPAIRSWAGIVGHFGKERCQIGVSVVVKRRPSGTAGRSYWVVVPDA